MASRKKKLGKRSVSPDQAKKEKQEKDREEEERRLIEEEALKLKQEALTESLNHARRINLLKSCCIWFEELEKCIGFLDWQKRLTIEWEKFINCGNLPIAHNIQMMNTYLHLLQAKNILWDVDNCFEMCPQLLSLIETVDDYIENPLGASYRRMENWREVRQGYRDVIHDSINMMCYNLVRNLNKNLTANDLWTYQFRKKCSIFFVGLWVFGEYPKLAGYPIQEFPEIGVYLEMPKPYDRIPGVLRVMKLSYNHLNDRCITWTCPQLPVEYNISFFQSQIDWFFEKVRQLDDFKLKVVDPELGSWVPGMFFTNVIDNGGSQNLVSSDVSTQARVGRKVKDKLGRIAQECSYKIVIKTKDTTSITVDVPIASIIDTLKQERKIDWATKFPRGKDTIASIEELVDKFETKGDRKKSVLPARKKSDKDTERVRIMNLLEDLDRVYTEQVIWKSLITNVDPGEVNLRKFNVIGSLFSIELFKLPEQEVLLKDKSRLTTIIGEQMLSKHDFQINYEAPIIVEEKQEEEEEGKEKKKGENLNKLMVITIGLEDNCLWFEPPRLVQWDNDRECWTDEYIIDPKYNEEKQNFTFRSGQLGIFGFCVPKYSNLPFQTWDIRPESEDCVLMNITASTVIADFKIKPGQVCVIQLQNAPNSILDPIIGQYMDPPILIKYMRRAGLDLFPDADSFRYVEGSNYKELILENHTYSCMALFANAYNFGWSRWNSFAGRNKLVFQMREFLERGRPYQMLLATQERTAVVECTEVNPSFSEKPIEGMEYYPDLYSLVAYHASPAAQERINSAHPSLVSSVMSMLKSTKVLTFS